MSHDAETLLRAHFPQYRRQAEERDRLQEQEHRRQQLDAANGKTQLGLGTTVRSPQNSVRTPEIAPCEGGALHGQIALKPVVACTSSAARPPRSRDFLVLDKVQALQTVQLLDKEEEGNSCTKQNELTLVQTSLHADEGNRLSATGDEDNTPARSPAHDAGQDNVASRQLEEENEITVSTPAASAPAPADYATPSEFAEANKITSIRCQLYDNQKLGKDSKHKSRFIVKTTINYEGGKRDIWFLRLLSEPRFFWRKTKRGGLSAADAEMLANLDHVKSELRKAKSATTIYPVIGRFFEDHEVQADCSGILAQEEGDMPIVWLSLHGTVFDVSITTPSKGNAKCSADCGIGYWNARVSRNAASQ